MSRWLYSLLSNSCICSMFIKNSDKSRVNFAIITSFKPPFVLSISSKDISMSTFNFLVRGNKEAQVSELLHELAEPGAVLCGAVVVREGKDEVVGDVLV